MPIAGLLWIRPFEGSRSRLRRTRQLWVLNRAALPRVSCFAVVSAPIATKHSVVESPNAADHRTWGGTYIFYLLSGLFAALNWLSSTRSSSARCRIRLSSA